jgi:hypothetical protein
VTADYLLGRVEEPTALAGAEQLHRHAQNLSADDMKLAEDFLKMLGGRKPRKE